MVLLDLGRSDSVNMSSKTFASQPSEITTKKKFGKNLNKQLSKPPPQSLGTAKPSPTSRNGLLLLSTKRQTSGVAASSTGGILANKSASGGTAKPLPSLGLQNKSITSTHDALLGAVVGASRAESQEPDAWGVADKCKSPILDPAPEPKEEMISERQEELQPSTNQESYTPDPREELPTTNWDEYGGRDLGADKKQRGLYSPEEIFNEDEQKAAMTKKANDRAAAKRAEEGSRQNEQRERISQRLKELDQKTSSETKSRTLFDPNMPSRKEGNVEATEHTEKNGLRTPEVDSFSRPPIQLLSFDDQDRGDRGASAVPRMLYDPKSGSMVAVVSRDDTSAGRGRKERGKKVKNVRDKESKPEERHDADGKRRGKREKKAGNDSGAPQKSEYKMGTDTAERKFPRTRGVLYSRDDKGNFISVDGCDGDLGYGSHSVPGGRVKNSDAYEAFLEQHQKNNRNDGLHDGVLDESFDTDVVHASNDLMLHTGFNLPKSDEAAFDWVKSGDTIELMTGNDGSPTLQATAKEWAPSRAALAAASARFGGRGERSTSFEDEEDDGEDDGPVRSLCIYFSFIVFDTNNSTLVWFGVRSYTEHGLNDSIAVRSSCCWT